jgi:hypothetical protein
MVNDHDHGEWLQFYLAGGEEREKEAAMKRWVAEDEAT